MKKRINWFASIIALVSCTSNPHTAHIEGEIAWLDEQAIYLYGADGNYAQMDTLVVQAGRFSHTLQLDTTSLIVLQLDSSLQIPLFLEKQDEIKIRSNSPDRGDITIEGSEANEAYSAFLQTLKSLKKPTEKAIEEKAEAFIRSHHTSPVSIYLLQHYFAQKPDPDYAKIRGLIEQMAGILQDNPIITHLKEQSEQADNLAKGKVAPYFNLPNEKGELITRTKQFKDKYLLVHFWASWDEPSKENLAALRAINRHYKKNKNFALLGVSLDLDRKAWNEAIKQDSLTWEQVCDFKGFNSLVVNQYAVSALPATLLIAPTGEIVAWNVKEEELKQLITKSDAD